MAVTIGGRTYDPNIASDQAALFAMGLMYYQGEWIPSTSIPGYRVPIAPALAPPAPGVTPATISFVGGVGGTNIQSPVAGVMINASDSLLGGAWSGFDPNNLASGLAILQAYAVDAYGSAELGIIRRSSEVLEQEPSGIRPGTMERIVIPVWARNERGSPI